MCIVHEKQMSLSTWLFEGKRCMSRCNLTKRNNLKNQRECKNKYFFKLYCERLSYPIFRRFNALLMPNIRKLVSLGKRVPDETPAPAESRIF